MMDSLQNLKIESEPVRCGSVNRLSRPSVQLGFHLSPYVIKENIDSMLTVTTNGY